MPEGDTILRAARTLQQAIGGKAVTRFVTVFPSLARVDEAEPIRGRTIDSVTARGKHLLIEFSGPLHLRTHLRMNGSWHLYRRGERWGRPRSDMRIVIETEEWVAVGFNLPVAEFLDACSLERSDELRRLGPDLLADDFDLDEARRRVRSRDDDEIANVLLNQQVVAGIGNVYKSEVLFIRRTDPFARAGALPDATIDAILTTARKLLHHNVSRLDPGRETRTGLRPDERLWVYGRRDQPCRRCGTRIEMQKQGTDARVTFWCPQCQRSGL